MTVTPIHERSSSVTSLVAIALSAAVLWGGLYCALMATVAVAYGNLIGLLFVALALLGIIALIALICRRLTGRARILAAMSVTGIAVVSLLLAVLNPRAAHLVAGGPGFQVVSMLMALTTALVLGAFLGPAWLRAIGALAIVASLGFWCWALAPSSDPTALYGASRDDQYQAFLELHGDSLVSGVAGSETVSLESSAFSAQMSWTRTVDDGVLVITVDKSWPNEEAAPLYPCWMIANSSMLLQSSDVVTDYAEWCVRNDAGWERTDGLGFVLVEEGAMIAVRSADGNLMEYLVDRRGHPATAAEVAEARDALRPITDDELQEFFLQTLD